MYLLPSCPISIPQFTSLSFLLSNPSIEGLSKSGASVMGGMPMILASSLTTVSYASAIKTLEELHAYLSTVILKSSDTSIISKVSLQDRFTLALLHEDTKLLDDVQIFRPTGAEGLALHYRVIRDDEEIISCLGLHIKGAARLDACPDLSASSIPSGCIGIVLCVGMSGLPHATNSSFLQFSLPQRMTDCINILSKKYDPQKAEAVLSLYLLADDEQRKTNDMTQVVRQFAFQSVDDIDKTKNPLSLSNVTRGGNGMVNFSKKKTMAGGTTPIRVGLGEGSKGNPRVPMVMTDGISDSDSTIKEKLGVTTIALRPDSADASLTITEQLNILSVAETDTFLRKYTISGHARKINLDLMGTNRPRFRRRKTDARDPDMDGFDFKGAKQELFKHEFDLESFDDSSTMTSGVASVKSPHMTQSSFRQHKQDVKAKSGVLPIISASGRDSTTIRRLRANQVWDEFSQFSESHNTAGRKRYSVPGASLEKATSFPDERRSATAESTSSSRNGLVNIVLNEDLSCSYKSSQLSTCSVEGVVQMQIKATAQIPLPIFLLVRDSAGHVDSFQENTKFAKDVTSTSRSFDESFRRMFAVSIPKVGTYIPVIRYKCSGDLRPVPIRVQTRIKVQGEYCRVALQISSNPSNEANLNDLTVMMGIPDELLGESLISQPSGGVWSEAKRSVIWSVSELGGGEKFQLQARFKVDRPFIPDNDKRYFPVLVRCQCLSAQLSDVEIAIRGAPGRYAADLTMILARRFRLSHRERS